MPGSSATETEVSPPLWTAVPGAVFGAETLQRRIRAAQAHAHAVAPAVAGAAVARLIAQADALNNRNSERPAWMRRILRKQGRINQRIRDAAEVVVNEAAEADPSMADLPQVREHVWRAQVCNHTGRGPALLRRLLRRQSHFNASLNDGLGALERSVTARLTADAPPPLDVAEQFDHLRWHIAEAHHLNSAARSGPLRFWRRIRRDQFMINRCHIVAVRILGALLQRR